MKKFLLGLLSVLLLTAGIGCMSLSEWLTPGEIDRMSVDYVVDAGLAEPNDFVGYANLFKVRKLDRLLPMAYSIKVQAIEQLAENNNLDYRICTGVSTTNLQRSETREEAWFGETGLLGALLPALGLGGIGGLAGLMMKRPGDITKKEYDDALADADIVTEERGEQLWQVVQGVKKFMATYDTVTPDSAESELVENLKTCLKGTTDTATRKVIKDLKTQEVGYEGITA
jgi:hypothetical protein